MPLQYLSDASGKQTAVVIPLNDWNRLKSKFRGIEKVISAKLPASNAPNHQISEVPFLKKLPTISAVLRSISRRSEYAKVIDKLYDGAFDDNGYLLHYNTLEDFA